MPTVLFFGELAELTGLREGNIDAEDTDSLKSILFTKWPELQNKTMMLAVNHKVAKANELLKEGDEIALMPPFSGG